MVGCPLTVDAVLSCRFKLIGGLLFILRFRLFLTAVGGIVGSLSLCSALPFGLPPGCLLSIRVGVPSRLRVQRVWGVYDERLQFMSRQDALHLDESIDAGDVSRAWLVWSGLLRLLLLMLVGSVVDPFLVGVWFLAGRAFVSGRQTWRSSGSDGNVVMLLMPIVGEDVVTYEKKLRWL